jgi:hypothetical protein
MLRRWQSVHPLARRQRSFRPSRGSETVNAVAQPQAKDSRLELPIAPLVDAVEDCD